MCAGRERAGLALEANATSAIGADGLLANQRDSQGIKRANELHQGVDITSDDTLASFHSLDGGDGQIALLGELPLVDAGKGPRGAQLGGCDHDKAIPDGKIDIPNIYFVFSHIRFDVSSFLNGTILEFARPWPS